MSIFRTPKPARGPYKSKDPATFARDLRSTSAMLESVSELGTEEATPGDDDIQEVTGKAKAVAESLSEILLSRPNLNPAQVAKATREIIEWRDEQLAYIEKRIREWHELNIAQGDKPDSDPAPRSNLTESHSTGPLQLALNRAGKIEIASGGPSDEASQPGYAPCDSATFAARVKGERIPATAKPDEVKPSSGTQETITLVESQQGGYQRKDPQSFAHATRR